MALVGLSISMFILEFVGKFVTLFVLVKPVYGFLVLLSSCFVSFYVGIQEDPQSMLSAIPIFSESH